MYMNCNISSERARLSPKSGARRGRAGPRRHVPLATAEIDRQTPTRTPTYIRYWALRLQQYVSYSSGSDYKQTTARAHWRRPRRYARTQALWKRREQATSCATYQCIPSLYYGTFLESKFLCRDAPSAPYRRTKGRFHTENKGKRRCTDNNTFFVW